MSNISREQMEAARKMHKQIDHAFRSYGGVQLGPSEGAIILTALDAFASRPVQDGITWNEHYTGVRESPAQDAQSTAAIGETPVPSIEQQERESIADAKARLAKRRGEPAPASAEGWHITRLKQILSCWPMPRETARELERFLAALSAALASPPGGQEWRDMLAALKATKDALTLVDRAYLPWTVEQLIDSAIVAAERHSSAQAPEGEKIR